MIPVSTIMGDIDGSARSENGENAGIIKASDVCKAERDLEAGTKSIGAHICRATRWVIYLGAVERWIRVIGIGKELKTPRGSLRLPLRKVPLPPSPRARMRYMVKNFGSA